MTLETDVLIVGAGPVGLTASVLLSRLGVRNRVVERRKGLHDAPQAHVVSARTLEIFRAAGVDESALRAVATPPEDVAAVRWVHTLAGPDLGCFSLATPERVHKLLTSTPTPVANISQHRLEPVLLEAARKAGAPVEFAWEWQSLSQDADGVRSLCANLTSGETEEIASRFVLACDGAGSRVRGAAGIEMRGPARIQAFHMVHLAADFREIVRGRPAILYWLMDPETPAIFIAHDIDSTWVFMIPRDAEDRATDGLDEAACRERVRRALGTDADFEIRSIDSWVMTAQVAERYRDARVFLVGDAAHRFPPTGGIGMNTGIADAHNLAWKLAAVLDGGASPALLDSYEGERREVAQRNCDQSLRNFREMADVVRALGVTPEMNAAAARAHLRAIPGDPARRAAVQAAVDRQADHFDTTGLDLGASYESGAVVGDGTPPPAPANPVTDYVPTSRPGSRLPHAWVERDGERVSTLDLVGPGEAILLVGAEARVWREAARGLGVPVLGIGTGCEIADPEGAWAAAREIPEAGALLVRPDGHVAWRAAEPGPDPEARLRPALDALRGDLAPKPVRPGAASA